MDVYSFIESSITNIIIIIISLFITFIILINMINLRATGQLLPWY
jgi:hypothetical protein